MWITACDTDFFICDTTIDFSCLWSWRYGEYKLPELPRLLDHSAVKLENLCWSMF